MVLIITIITKAHVRKAKKLIKIDIIKTNCLSKIIRFSCNVKVVVVVVEFTEVVINSKYA